MTRTARQADRGQSSIAGRCVTSSGTGLLEPQREFLDFA
jgi:hypothetical protein